MKGQIPFLSDFAWEGGYQYAIGLTHRYNAVLAYISYGTYKEPSENYFLFLFRMTRNQRHALKRGD